MYGYVIEMACMTGYTNKKVHEKPRWHQSVAYLRISVTANLSETLQHASSWKCTLSRIPCVAGSGWTQTQDSETMNWLKEAAFIHCNKILKHTRKHKPNTGKWKLGIGSRQGITRGNEEHRETHSNVDDVTTSGGGTEDLNTQRITREWETGKYTAGTNQT